MSIECPRCRQMGYEVGMSFHWNGGEKQCAVCGQDWPSNRCPKCYKVSDTHNKGMEFSRPSCTRCGQSEEAMSFSDRAEVTVQKVKLPYPYTWGNRTAYIEDWSELPECLIVRVPKEGNEWGRIQLTQKETMNLLSGLSLQPHNIPGYNQKVKLPHPFTYNGKVAYIEGWSNLGWPVGGLLVRTPKSGSGSEDSWEYKNLSREETDKLLLRIGLQPHNIPYTNHQGQALQVQKVKLPFSYTSDAGVAYIEGWSTPECLLIRVPRTPGAAAQFKTLNSEETIELLRRLGLRTEDIPGYQVTAHHGSSHAWASTAKPKKKAKAKKESVEHVSREEWEAFQRWKESVQEVESIVDDNLLNFKELLKSFTNACPEFDEDFEDLLSGIRELPRIMRYIKTGNHPPADMDDEDIAYYDESHYLSGSHWGGRSHGRQKTIVKVVIEDISDGKL